jgi:hypothetical protein
MSAKKAKHVFFTLVAIVTGLARTYSYSSYLSGSPSWSYGCSGYYYYSYVSDGFSPITSVTFNQSSTGYLYGVVVNGIKSGTSTDSITLSPVPNYHTTGTTSKTTVTIAATKTVTLIEAWHQNTGGGIFLT